MSYEKAEHPDKKILLSLERELVLVGALHLSGERGVLAQLLKAGYTVKQLDEVDGAEHHPTLGSLMK